ncbi:ABC transporter permease [Neptuniibacter sp. QD72_48]|uniref:ABC transporter permease n=1 Tax=unclassified Neptuniibacter TaxID=2630693 RepID=UPI0039F4AA9A
MILFRLTWQSLLNRKSTILLTVLSLSVSIMLVMAVDTLRTQTKSSFSSTVSGTDLIVGAKGGSINLLLYSVFRLGDATNNLSWSSYQAISRHSKVAWSIPFSLGDSHRGYPVLGTSSDYFKYFRYGKKQPLALEQGKEFEGVFDVVIGSDVAEKLQYKLGDSVVIAHGRGNASLVEHDDKPFKVVGILEPTGTPVDQTLHVSLAAIEAIHIDWKAGVQIPGSSGVYTEEQLSELEPKQITAFMLGLTSRFSTFHLQRSINQYSKEPLQAIIPGLALQSLWQMFSLAEQALLVVSGLVIISSMLGLMTLLLASLNERRREIAILRSVGARLWQILSLLILESFLVTAISIILGMLLLYLNLLLLAPWLQTEFGVWLSITGPTLWQWQLIAVLLVSGTVVGAVPGYRAYKQSLADGVAVKI